MDAIITDQVLQVTGFFDRCPDINGRDVQLFDEFFQAPVILAVPVFNAARQSDPVADVFPEACTDGLVVAFRVKRRERQQNGRNALFFYGFD